jgi:hypothetical protein
MPCTAFDRTAKIIGAALVILLVAAVSRQPVESALSQPTQPPRNFNDERRESARVGYQVAIQLRNYEGSMVWARYSVMMTANSIIIGGTILVLTRIPQLSILAWALPIVGLLTCIAWLILTWGGMAYFRYLTLSARELEERFLLPPVETL